MADLKITALAGGVGGAKLVDGLAQYLHPEDLIVIVNTADDFTHLGLKISPDLDTVCYTLAGLANPDTGWGRASETWNVFENLKKLGMPDWFQLGDADLATHLVRTACMNEGLTLSQITTQLCESWAVRVNVLPMSDEVVQTWVHTDQGELEFQEYFVRHRCEPRVKGFGFVGAEHAKPAPGVMDAIEHCDAVVICPSNPWVSIDPILSVPQIKPALKNKLVLAVSPILGGKTVKGPAAKMFSELGIQPTALAVARHYEGVIHTIAIDNSDEQLVDEITNLGIHTLLTNILMRDRPDRGRLALELLEYIDNLRGR